MRCINLCEFLIFQVVGFLWGYYIQQFGATVIILAAGFIVSSLVSNYRLIFRCDKVLDSHKKCLEARVTQWIRACFPPLWPQFDCRTRHLVWVEFVVGFCLHPKVFLHVPWFSSFHKNQHFQIPLRFEWGLVSVDTVACFPFIEDPVVNHFLIKELLFYYCWQVCVHSRIMWLIWLVVKIW